MILNFLFFNMTIFKKHSPLGKKCHQKLKIQWKYNDTFILAFSLSKQQTNVLRRKQEIFIGNSFSG